MFCLKVGWNFLPTGFTAGLPSPFQKEKVKSLTSDLCINNNRGYVRDIYCSQLIFWAMKGKMTSCSSEG